MQADFRPESVLEFWFPDDGHERDPETHMAFWLWRMQGGADLDIQERFAELTLAAARGELDHWAGAPYGRLALLIALDQFPRSLWRDTPAAYGQDIKATRLVLEAFENGHYQALSHVWERQFCLIAVSHCEGPDHLKRMEMLERLTLELVESAPAPLRENYGMSIEQVRRVRAIIERFGRHPHRNPILGRVSTPEEEEYIAKGDFPHNRPPEPRAEQ